MESKNSGSLTATGNPFTIAGGLYGVAAIAGSWGTSATLECLGPDGETYVPVNGAQFTANGTLSLYLPAGQYKWVLAGSFTGFYGSVTTVPLRNQ